MKNRKWTQRFLQIWGLFPLSLTGLFILPLVLWLRFKYVPRHQDYVLLVLSTSVLALFVLQWLQLSWATILFFRSRKKSLDPLQSFTHLSSWSGFQFKASWLTPVLEFSLFILGNPNCQTGLIRKKRVYQEFWQFSRRALLAGVERRIVIRDFLGLFKFDYRFWTPQNIRIQTRLNNKFNLTLSQILVSGADYSHPAGKAEGDLADMRKYQPGDPLNRVLWKVYGRTRTMMVRTEEKAVTKNKRCRIYLVTGPQDETAAELAWTTLQNELGGQNYIFGADGVADSTSNLMESQEALLISAGAQEIGGNLGSFFTALLSEETNDILFAPPKSGPWIDRLCSLASNLKRPIQVIIPFSTPALKASGKKRSQEFEKITHRLKSHPGISLHLYSLEANSWINPQQWNPNSRRIA